MSKPLRTTNLVVRVVFLALMAALVIGGLGVLVLLFFIPIVGWLVWRLYDRTAELEKRLAAIERPAGEAKPSDQ
jgi:hypothetical protein